MAYSCTVTGCSSKVDQPDKYTILNDYAYCEMGGIIGNFQLGTISDCVNESNLKTERPYCKLGGIVGLTTGGVIQRCVQTGKFSYLSAGDTGGIVGNFGTTHGLTDGDLFIEDCIALNSLQLIGNLTYSSGLVFENDTTTYIRNCYTDGCLLDDLVVYQHANISNSFYGNKLAYVDRDRSDYERFITENVNKATDSMVKSGEVAYKLRQTSSRASWGQQIGTDEYPVLNGPRVYYGYENCQSTTVNYSNDVRYEKQGVGHQYNEMGACTLCGARGGSEEYPYPILTAEDLKKFADAVNGGASTLCAKLMKDIDLNPGTTFNISDGTYSGNTPTEWTPMGTKDVPYCGTFDGAGHKISGLYVHSTANYSGLFGYCAAASDDKTPVIKNLSVDNSSINVPYIYSTGGIVGYIENGTISNCSSSAYVCNDGSNAYVGGIAGEAVNSTISTCSNSSTVASYSGAGGIDGKGVGNTISECYNTGEVKVYKSSSYAGGISGMEGNSSLINVYNTGNIYLYNDSPFVILFSGSIGGIAGFGGCYIANGYNTGELNCINTSGGMTQNAPKGVVIGEAGSNMEINNFYYSDADLPLSSQGQAMAPAKDGESTMEVPWVYSFDFGLPAGVEDLNAFVRNPQSRLPIYVKKPNFTVSDTTDLSAYDLVAMETLEEEYGFHIGSMSINNVDQHFQKNDYRGKMCTELWEYGCWYKADGFELFGIVHERSEERRIETNELTVSDIKFNPETDLLFEQMSYGYRWSVFNEDWSSDYSFVLRAYKGAEILNSDFYYLDTKENPSAKSTETIWLERDGYYVLASAANHSPLKLYDDKKLVRKNQTDSNGTTE